MKPTSRPPLLLAALSLLSLLGAPVAASAQTLQVAFSEIVRGGVTTDAWGEASSPTAFARGEFTVQVPRGGRVRWARLYSGVTVFNPTASAPAFPPSIPAGPSGSPRQVIVGNGTSTVTRTLQGAPRFYSRTFPTSTVTAHWGTFITDVSSAVRAAVGPSSRGGTTRITVQERGDDARREGPGIIQLGGHYLVVVYDLDFGPRRNVVVYEGCATNGFESAALPLPGAVANRCPSGFTRGEPFAASVGVMWEFNRRPNPAAPNDPSRDTCSEEESEIIVNNLSLTTRAGGADDWPGVAAGMGCFADTAGLCTMGTFGGTEPGPGRAAGSPVGLDGDNIIAAPALPRLDDELYDFRTVVSDAATSMRFRFRGDGDEMVPVIAFQTLARASLTDADGDNWTDVVEGDCTADTDNDGTPDYLDIDSDNDCLPDVRETASGRTNPMSPGAADANCPATAPICDTAAGVCLCNTTSDCTRTPIAPVCDPASRTCVACSSDAQCASIDPSRPACVLTGSAPGRCAACNTDAQCSGATPFCDVGAHTCVACLTSRDCADPANPVCDPAGHVCRPCNPSLAGECTLDGMLICAGTGPNMGRCVQCTTNLNCASGVCDLSTNRCVGCGTNADCAGSTPICDAGTRTCRPCSPSNPTDCRAPTPACATTGRDMGRCVACTAENMTACTGATPMCDAAMNRCVACIPGSAAAVCAMSADGTACVMDASGSRRCGCDRDADCGATDSGRICDPTARRCRAGCWPGEGHNGCPAGMTCSSDDPTRPGTCATGCFRDLDCAQPTPFCETATDGGAGRCVGCLTDAHCADRTDGLTRCSEQHICVEGPAPAPGAITTLSGDGCGCHVGMEPDSAPRLGFLLLAGLGVWALRRRRDP
ncbi:MAG: hypothetical protein IPN17_24710 [Deltaproteobacteria bacterium]|nr:hypothetical protein [Deltaproteobacteria bacterium]